MFEKIVQCEAIIEGHQDVIYLLSFKKMNMYGKFLPPMSFTYGCNFKRTKMTQSEKDINFPILTEGIRY